MDPTQKALQRLQCPFNWKLDDIRWTSTSGRLQLSKKLDSGFGTCDGSTLWQQLSQRFVLAYLEYNDDEWPRNRPTMIMYLKMIERILEDYTDEFIKRNSKAIRHVLSGMYAYAYYSEELNVMSIIQLHLSNAGSFEKLAKSDQAGVFAMKACCLMEFGPANGPSEAALMAINKALELNPNEREWSFLKGKVLARNRRYKNFNSPPSLLEIGVLRQAVCAQTSSPFPSHLVFLGQSLLDYATHSPDCQGPQKRATKNAYQNECVEIMKKAAVLGDKDGVILARVTKGLMRQVPDDDSLLQYCVQRSLVLLPNSTLVNEVAGSYFNLKNKNPEQAMKHFRIASKNQCSISAHVKLLDLVFLHKPGSEFQREVKKFWDTYRKDPNDRTYALVLMTAYYFFVKDNIVKATYRWSEWITYHVKTGEDGSPYNSIFVWTPDLTKCLVGEVQTKLRDRQSSLSSKDEDKLRSFLTLVQETRSDLDISRITKSRVEIIRAYLTSLKSPKKELLERNLCVTAERSFVGYFRSPILQVH